MKRPLSILPSILHAYPGPSQSMQLYSITDPPLNFTVPLTSLSLSPSPTLFQAHFLPSDPRWLILVSYDHTTLFQSSRVHSLCLIAKSILSFLCFCNRRDFLLHHCLHISSPEVSVRGRPVFRSKAVLEFYQLWPWTPLAFFRLRPPPSSGDALKYFLFQAPFNSPQCYRCEVCLRYFTKSLRATVFMQTVYSTVVQGYS